jgi:arsenite methyltransferase
VEPKQLEQLYSCAEMDVQRRAVIQALTAKPGQRGLEVGSGPGHLAAIVGPGGGRIAAVDKNPAMVAMLRERAEQAGQADHVEARVGDALELPFASESFDFSVNTQVISYFARPERMLAELFRTLVPGGRAVILDTHWDSLIWRADDTKRAARREAPRRYSIHDARPE